jgi:hypothetical protein
MIEGRNAGEAADPVHLGFGEQRRPLLQGDARHYLEVVRFGFSPTDFALEIERVPGKHTPNSSVPTFTVTVRNIHRLYRATYHGGPGRAWVAEFLRDLIAGKFGQP